LDIHFGQLFLLFMSSAWPELFFARCARGFCGRPLATAKKATQSAAAFYFHQGCNAVQLNNCD
jgi:hypothetical protein